MFSRIIFAYLTVFITSDDSEPKERIIKYREMILTMYGEASAAVENNQYEMDIFINNTRISSSTIPVLKRIFRCEEHLEDYVDDELIYHDHLQMKIDIRKKTTPGITIFDGVVNMYPDSKENLDFKNTPEFTIEFLFIQLNCVQYTGLNCRFLKEDNNTHFTAFEDGKMTCKNIADCFKDDEQCSDRSYCKNGGHCYEQKSLSKYCVCKIGFSGPHCEFEDCSFDEDEFLYGDHTEFCQQTSCSIEYCNNRGICTQYGSFKHCVCADNTTHSGKRCEFTCNPSCTMKHCTFDEHGSYCYLSNKDATVLSKNVLSPFLHKTSLFCWSKILLLPAISSLLLWTLVINKYQ